MRSAPKKYEWSYYIYFPLKKREEPQEFLEALPFPFQYEKWRS
jgi:hypothetical protein